MMYPGIAETVTVKNLYCVQFRSCITGENHWFKKAYVIQDQIPAEYGSGDLYEQYRMYNVKLYVTEEEFFLLQLDQRLNIVDKFKHMRPPIR